MHRLLGRYRACRRGNLAITFAIALPVLLAMAGAAVDFTRRIQQVEEVREAADALTVLGARELMLANASASKIISVVTAAAKLYETPGGAPLQVVATPDVANGTVSVNVTQAAKPTLFLKSIETFSKPIEYESTAAAMGGMNVCVIALDDRDDGAVETSFSAKIAATNCSILSNSTSVNGVAASGSSKITAGMICSAGGYKGAVSNFEPTPVTDCPEYPDPLVDRPAPTYAGCDENDLVLGEQSEEATYAAIGASIGEFARRLSGSEEDEDDDRDMTSYKLDPGVYCGGLTIASNADVTLRPGIYVIKDGPFRASLGARLTGANVGFYLVGDASVFTFDADSKIHLTAPVTGAMAGLLFFEDRGAPLDRTHAIYSDDARTLLGTFYLSRGVLSVATLFPVADQSAYTAIVARSVKLSGGPTLTLNTDYAATTVPVPDGVGPVGGQVALRN